MSVSSLLLKFKVFSNLIFGHKTTAICKSSAGRIDVQYCQKPLYFSRGIHSCHGPWQAQQYNDINPKHVRVYQLF
jgi:hypothetical protein